MIPGDGLTHYSDACAEAIAINARRADDSEPLAVAVPWPLNVAQGREDGWFVAFIAPPVHVVYLDGPIYGAVSQLAEGGWHGPCDG